MDKSGLLDIDFEFFLIVVKYIGYGYIFWIVIVF